MFLKRTSVGLWFLLAAGCGAKSGLFGPEPLPEQIEPKIQPIDGVFSTLDAGTPGVTCQTDTDCQATDVCFIAFCRNAECVPDPIDCDDADPCTLDGCESELGCFHDSVARDEDQDGYEGALPGFALGTREACGDDCDDTSADAFPGNREICDGVDNDCNGVVDDGATFVPTSLDPVHLSAGTKQAGLGGFVYNGDVYAVAAGYQTEQWDASFMTLDAAGSFVLPPQPITERNNDTQPSDLTWTGSVFATVWEDRQDNDYEIYFNRVDADGNRLAADLRVTNAPDFSTRADVLWNGTEYIVVWQDRRAPPDSGGPFAIYGQRISAQGELIGENVPLTGLELDAEGPGIVEGDTALGLVFNYKDLDGRRIGFRTVSTDLQAEPGPVVIVSSSWPGVGGGMLHNAGRFVVSWTVKGERSAPGDAVYGASLSESGEILIPEKRLTEPAELTRSHSMVALGDRILLLWSEYRNGTFQIYTKELTPELDELTPPIQVTASPGDAFGPAPAFGPNGDVGIVYTDQRDGTLQLYFTRLLCDAGVVIR